jgi:hypothetical protein
MGKEKKIRLCSQCGKPVSENNDALMLWALADYTKDDMEAIKFIYVSKHLLPIDGCNGSPSRAQYLEGQPRDSRFPYNKQLEEKFRKAFEELQKLAE